MKKYLSLIIIIIVCIIVFVSVYFLYDYLKDNYSDQNSPANNSSDKITTKNESPSYTSPDTSDGQALENNNSDYNDFTVFDKSNNAKRLSDVVKEGKPVVINFWTTWCGYCKQEMPDFNEVYKEYGDRVNFMMVDVNGGGNDDKDKAIKYLNENNFEFPVYFDTELSAYTAYTVTAFPATVILDENGVTYYKGLGAISKDSLITMVEDILK